MNTNRKKFSLDKMAEKLDKIILDKMANNPSQVQLKLPKLKKVGNSQLPKIKLPKLKKITEDA